MSYQQGWPPQPHQQPEKRKGLSAPMFALTVVGITAAVVLLFALLTSGGGSISPDPSVSPSETNQQGTTASSPQESTEPSESVTPSPSVAPETTAEAVESLAGGVETALLEANGVDSFRALQASSPGFWIVEVEDVSSGTVRVHVQTELTDDERDSFALWVINMSCMSVEQLDTVVMRDTSGIDSNHYKHRMSRVLPACED